MNHKSENSRLIATVSRNPRGPSESARGHVPLSLSPEDSPSPSSLVSEVDNGSSVLSVDFLLPRLLDFFELWKHSKMAALISDKLRRYGARRKIGNKDTAKHDVFRYVTKYGLEKVLSAKIYYSCQQATKILNASGKPYTSQEI